MENGTIFLPTNDKERIIQTIQDVFSHEKIDTYEDSVVITRSKLFSKTTYTIKIMTERDDFSEIANMKLGQKGFIEQALNGDPDCKNYLLRHNANIRAMLGLVSDKNWDESLFQGLLAITKKLNGFLFKDGATYLNGDGKIILNFSGECQLSKTELVDERPVLNMTGVRFENIERILELGLPLAPIPYYEERTNFKEIEEVCKRIIALFIVAIKADGFQQSIELERINGVVSELIQTFQATDFFSAKEKEFMATDHPTPQQITDGVWGFEALYTLMSMVGLVEELDLPVEMCKVDQMSEILFSLDNFGQLVKMATFRDDIWSQTDFTYLLHWITEEQRIRVEPMELSVPLSGDILLERHKALNWLFYQEYLDWDEVEVNT